MSPRDLHRTRGLPVLEEALILAVDDTPANLVALERVLGSIEARIIRASSGEEALALCLRHRFALAILDVQMPGMDGYELAEILLGDPATSRTPIIFMTAAFFDERHIFKGYVTGAVDYIIKPYNPEMLQAKVRVFLELAQQRQQLEQMLIERNRALDASEDRFDDLFELAPQALLMGRPDGSIQQSNVAAAALFGYSQEGLKACQIGDLLPDFRLSAAGLPASTLENTADLRDLGEVPTWTARRRDGGTLRVEVRVSHTEIGGQTRTLISVTDVSERVRAFESVQRSLREKEVLLKEVHHRVKNNLQVVSSLLGLQSAKSTAEEVQVILEDCVGRVRSMAIVHEQLYGSDSLSEINLGEYVRSLGDILCGTYAAGTRLVVNADENVKVSIEVATPLGLLLNEIITNALKHGLLPRQLERRRRTGPHCDLLIEIRSGAESTDIVITDSGPGLPENATRQNSTSIGMELIRGLSRQIGAALSFHSEDGLQVALKLAPACAD